MDRTREMEEWRRRFWQIGSMGGQSKQQTQTKRENERKRQRAKEKEKGEESGDNKELKPIQNELLTTGKVINMQTA